MGESGMVGATDADELEFVEPVFVEVVRSCPHAARMSRPRGHRTVANAPARGRVRWPKKREKQTHGTRITASSVPASMRVLAN